jgi:hypothetical protein
MRIRSSRPFALLALTAILAGTTSVAAATSVRLTEVTPDGCSPTLVYSAVLSKEQIRSKRHPTGVIPVMHDNCSNGSELVVGLDGEHYRLSRPVERGDYRPLYEGSPFAWQAIQVEVRGGELILDLPETNESCGGQWRKVEVTVKKGAQLLRFGGTLVSSC